MCPETCSKSSAVVNPDTAQGEYSVLGYSRFHPRLIEDVARLYSTQISATILDPIFNY